MRRFAAVCALAAAISAAAAPATAKDLSAETLAIIHDLMAPYRGGAMPELSASADPQAVAQALEILRKEKLIDFARPQARPAGVADKLGRALAMGQRTPQFLPEISGVHDALLHQDRALAATRVGELYRKMGRKPPEGAGLETLLDAAAKVIGDRPQETERVSIERPDYTVLVENAKAAGKAMISVLDKRGPGGEPARVEFKGEVATEADSSGKDLATKVTPAGSAETMTAAQAAELRDRLNGRWRDQEGVEYDITGEGTHITITELRPDKPPRPYVGTFDLGLIRARFAITKPDDMGEGLPLKVRQQLAGMGLTFDLLLSVDSGGTKLDGTWSSQHVTYGSDEIVSRVHDPYDVAMTLTRGDELLAEGAAEGVEP